MSIFDDLPLGGDYVTHWDDLIGQKDAKRQLQIAAKSARLRGVPMDHTLLASGSPGIGKTQLALLTAQECGAENVKIISGKIPANQARIALSGLDDGDVLIYDEIHMAVQGGKGNAEWLLHLLQDGVLMGPTGPEEQPKITIIGATTDVGRLPRTIIDRFGKQPDLAPYSDEEAELIALGKAHRLFGDDLPLPSPENIAGIARAALNNPRVIGHLSTNLRDIALASDLSNYDKENGYDLTEALEWMGLTPDGLNRLARRYLVALVKDFAGGAGERALADRLGEAGGLGHVEKVLMDKGLLAKTRQGRTLTSAGIKRAQLVTKNGEDA